MESLLLYRKSSGNGKPTEGVSPHFVTLLHKFQMKRLTRRDARQYMLGNANEHDV